MKHSSLLLSKEKWLERFYGKHGSKYDYSHVDFSVGAHHKVKIICPIHGEFFQTKGNHTKGGCKKCAGQILSENTRRSKAEWLNIFDTIHHSKYDYSVTDFSNKKLTIKCPIHGLFQQNRTDHLSYGCLNCGRIKQSQSRRNKSLYKNKETIIGRFLEVHKGEFDYSSTIIPPGFSAKTVIDICCKIHGIFSMRITAHIHGRRCQKCANIRRALKFTDFNRKKKYKDTDLYTESFYEERFLDRKQDIISTIKRGPVIRYINPITNTEHNYFPDFIIGDTIYEVKSLWTWGKEKNVQMINNAKLNAALNLGYKVVLVYEGKEIIWCPTYEI